MTPPLILKGQYPYINSESLWKIAEGFLAKRGDRMNARKNANKKAIGLAGELRKKLAEQLGEPLQIILFGSQARGEADDTSDIDVLVLLSNLEKGTLDIVLQSAWEVGFEAGKVISVIPATFEEIEVLSASPFFQAVQKEGIPV